MNESLVLQTIIIALSTGVFCQLLAEALKVPSIIFLLFLGALLGPQFLAWVQPDAIQKGLTPIIEIGVAIILFEGGLSLRFDQFRSSSSVIQKMLTQGALVTFVGASLASHWIVGLPWRYCFIFGALMIVSGPTVINPIIRRFPLKRNLAAILNWESILLDPVGAILAIFIADFVLSEGGNYFYTFLKFLKILASGAFIGVLFGKGMQFLLKKTDRFSEEIVKLMILSAALLSFMAAELWAHHSGLLAVVVSGMVLTNGELTAKQRESIVEFKEILANLWVGFIFILLAARLNVQEVWGLGLRGLFFVVVLLFLVRPLSIFLSTRLSSLSVRDKLFLSWMAPKGIVAASTASLFALLFEAQGYADARALENLTYGVIAVAVALQSLTKPLGQLLGVLEKRNAMLIIGAHSLARKIALWLQARSIEVKLVDIDFGDVDLALKDGLEAYHGDALDRYFVENLPIQRVGCLIALTSSNKVNILACQLGAKLIGPRSSFQFINRTAKTAPTAFEEMGGIPIFPQLPFLDEVNLGLEEGSYEWREKIVPKKFIYDGPLREGDGEYWPLFHAKALQITVLPAGQLFSADTPTVGLLKRAK